LESIVLCITGASGSIYGLRLLEVLYEKGFQIDLVVSSAGALVLKEELELSVKDLQERFPKVRFVSERAVGDRIASGSRLIKYKGVVVGTLLYEHPFLRCQWHKSKPYPSGLRNSPEGEGASCSAHKGSSVLGHPHREHATGSKGGWHNPPRKPCLLPQTQKRAGNGGFCGR
jgi:hypothetical protein